MKTNQSMPEGVLAEFSNPNHLMQAAKALRDAGYQHFDCHSPFPIHGMDEAMGLKPSPLGWIVGGMAFLGAGLAILLQWWTSAIDYPIIISGKPFFSYQAFAPVTFGLAVLLGAVTAFFGMLALNRLPQPFHPVFFSDNFAKASDDGFFLSVLAADPKFDIESTSSLLRQIGGQQIQVLKEDSADVQ